MINEYYTYSRIILDDKGQPVTRESGGFEYFLETRSVYDISGFADAPYKTGILYIVDSSEEIRTKETRLMHLNAIVNLKEDLDEQTIIGGDD